MTIWTNDRLSQIGDADHLLVVTRRPDGTMRKPVPVWVVRVGNDLFIRPVRGRYSSWYRGTQARRDGQIRVDETEQEILFELADPALGDAIDTAYRTKYLQKSARHVAPILTPSARGATLRLVPVAPGSGQAIASDGKQGEHRADTNTGS